MATSKTTPTILVKTDEFHKARVDLLAIPVWSGFRDSHAFEALDTHLQGALRNLAKQERFEGKRSQVLKLPFPGPSLEASWVLLVGSGDERNPTAVARRLAVAAARAARGQRSAALVLPQQAPPEAFQAAAEGVVTGGYRFLRYKTGKQEPAPALRRVLLLADKATRAARQAVARGVILGECVNLARDWVNMPPNEMNPPALARAAEQLAKEHGLQSTIWNKARLRREGMNLILAVASGSAVEPRFIHLRYKPKGVRKPKRVAFVGKGLTFDAGGLCLKTAKGMADMKCDMAGAAATLAIAAAAARLQLPVEVHALVGADGAGKSTLMKILGGAYGHYVGEIYFDGKKVDIRNPQDAKALGIDVVYQEVDTALISYLTVAENIMMDKMVNEMKGKHFIRWGNIHREAREVMKRVGIDLDTHTLVQDLSLAQKQMVLIARALATTGGNVTHAAKLLKISRKSLQTKMKEFGLRGES